MQRGRSEENNSFSVTNPSLDSPYPYFKGKAEVEDHLKESGVPYTIIRPALIFDDGDILMNNIAWLLRRSPVFGIFGSGNFQVQPISQTDLANFVVEHVIYPQLNLNQTIDAVGPETFTFKEIIRLLNYHTNSKTLIIPFPGVLKWIPFTFSKIFGWLLKDVLLTRHEMNALIDNLLLTQSEPVGTERFEGWLKASGGQLGVEYAHEINRHYR